MNIAICTDSFLPVRNSVGRSALAYASACGLAGHDCFVVTPMTQTMQRAHFPFEIVDFLSPKQPSDTLRIGRASFDAHYRARMQSVPLDIVHTHSPGLAGMEAVRLAEKNRVPLIGTFHPTYFSRYFENIESDAEAFRREHFIIDYFNRCDEVWTASEEARAFLITRGMTCPVEVFENGADTEPAAPEEIEQVKRRYHLSDAPVLLLVGHLSEMKNLPRIMGAAELLKARGCAYQLLLVGDGSEVSALKEQIVARGLAKQVRFLGGIPSNEELKALYALSSLSLFPFRSLSAGLVVSEAAAQGTPSLVLSGASSSERIVNGENGLICADTAASMADTVERYLSDPVRMLSISENARRTVPTPWSDVTERVLERYAVLSGRDRAELVRKSGPFRRELQAVDNRLETRGMELALNFLNQDTSHIYAFPYRQSKRLDLMRADSTFLPRSTPEAQGVSSLKVLDMVNALAADPDAHALELMILRHGNVIFEGSFAPYRADTPRQLYSLSKSVTSTAIGMLWDENRLALDEKLSDIFHDLMPDDAEHPAYSLIVLHLLTMSTGSLFNEAGTPLGANWEKEFLRAGVKFPAGSAFDYNSLNTYMLASIVRRKTGQTLNEFLTPRLFRPLGIESHVWDTSPMGTEKGGWGLNLTAESVAKIGQLYLNRGVWTVDGTETRLLSETWIDMATAKQIDTPKGEITFGYGYQIWKTAHEGAFLFNGAFGQYMLALPDKDAIVVLLSGTPRLFANGGVTAETDTLFADASDTPLPEDPASLAVLREVADRLTVSDRAAYRPVGEPMEAREAVERLDGLVFSFDANTGGLYPSILCNVMNNFPRGIRAIAFRREGEDALRMEVSEGDTLTTLTLRDDRYIDDTVTQRTDIYRVSCRMLPSRPDETGVWRMKVLLHFVETPFTRILTFAFHADSVTLTLDESPSVREAGEMLLELMGVTHAQLFRTLMPLIKRDKAQARIRAATTVQITGRL